MSRKFIFYTHPYARRLLKNTDKFACVVLNNHVMHNTRARVRPQLEDVAQWVHDQFVQTPKASVANVRTVNGRVHDFELVPHYRSVARIDMAERLLAAPNRRVVITAVE